MLLSIHVLCLLAAAVAAVVRAQDFCSSPTRTYTARVNLFAGELGYFTFDECPGMISPTIGLEIGETYTFSQADRSNYFHPMGFAYFPDGALSDSPELEPGVLANSESSACQVNLTCPAPMYFSGDDYLGTYSNIPEVLPVTTGEDNFGLDDYEPLFFRPIGEWSSFPPFNIRLKYSAEDYDEDLFYFCHIHQFMSGRIKLLQNGIPVNSADTPPLPYTYDEPGTFDETCGTFDLDAFALPNAYCPSEDMFVCDTEDKSEELQTFSSCIDAMNCHMMAGMTTGVRAESEIALFIHQMIPHHQNAVNMAKALLFTNKLDCDSLEDEDNPECIMEAIIYEIINGQNNQIQLMRGVLEAFNYPQTDNCEVVISLDQQEPPPAPTSRFFTVTLWNADTDEVIGILPDTVDLCLYPDTSLSIAFEVNESVLDGLEVVPETVQLELLHGEGGEKVDELMVDEVDFAEPIFLGGSTDDPSFDVYPVEQLQVPGSYQVIAHPSPGPSFSIVSFTVVGCE